VYYYTDMANIKLNGTTLTYQGVSFIIGSYQPELEGSNQSHIFYTTFGNQIKAKNSTQLFYLDDVAQTYNSFEEAYTAVSEYLKPYLQELAPSLPLASTGYIYLVGNVIKYTNATGGSSTATVSQYKSYIDVNGVGWHIFTPSNGGTDISQQYDAANVYLDGTIQAYANFEASVAGISNYLQQYLTSATSTPASSAGSIYLVLNTVNYQSADGAQGSEFTISQYKAFTDTITGLEWHKFIPLNGDPIFQEHSVADIYFDGVLQVFADFAAAIVAINAYLAIATTTPTVLSTIIVGAKASATSIANNTNVTIVLTTTNVNVGTAFNDTTFTAPRAMTINISVVGDISYANVTTATIQFTVYVNGVANIAGTGGRYGSLLGVANANVIQSSIYYPIVLAISDTVLVRCVQTNSAAGAKTLTNILLSITEIGI